MPGYVVVQVKVEDPTKYEEYRKQVLNTVERYGGRFLVRGGDITTLEGDWDPGRFVIVEFDSPERAKQWYFSDEYSEPKKLRQAAAQSKVIVAAGV